MVLIERTEHLVVECWPLSPGSMRKLTHPDPKAILQRERRPLDRKGADGSKSSRRAALWAGPQSAVGPNIDSEGDPPGRLPSVQLRSRWRQRRRGSRSRDHVMRRYGRVTVVLQPLRVPGTQKHSVCLCVISEA